MSCPAQPLDDLAHPRHSLQLASEEREELLRAARLVILGQRPSEIKLEPGPHVARRHAEEAAGHILRRERQPISRDRAGLHAAC
jgi:hypothetical protein